MFFQRCRLSCREVSAALTCWNRTPDESLPPPPQSPQPFSDALLRAPSRPPQRISPSLRALPRPPPAPRLTAAPAEAAAALALILRCRLRRPRARPQPQKGPAPRPGTHPPWLPGPAMTRRRRFSPLGGRPPAGRAGAGAGAGPGRRVRDAPPPRSSARAGASPRPGPRRARREQREASCRRVATAPRAAWPVAEGLRPPKSAVLDERGCR